MTNDEKTPITIPPGELKSAAAALAEQMRSAAAPLAPELRARFIQIRAALFQRGVFDPVLVRFDTATVPKASVAEVSEELSKVASSL